MWCALDVCLWGPLSRLLTNRAVSCQFSNARSTVVSIKDRLYLRSRLVYANVLLKLVAVIHNLCEEHVGILVRNTLLVDHDRCVERCVRLERIGGQCRDKQKTVIAKEIAVPISRSHKQRIRNDACDQPLVANAQRSAINKFWVVGCRLSCEGTEDLGALYRFAVLGSSSSCSNSLG